MDETSRQAKRLNEALKQSLRTLMSGVNTPRPATKMSRPKNETVANYFDELKENVKEIRNTHYSPAKIGSRGTIPDLAPGTKQNQSVGGDASPVARRKSEKVTSFALRDIEERPSRVSTQKAEAYNDLGSRISHEAALTAKSASDAKTPTSRLVRAPQSRTHILVNKIDLQNERIEQLESEVRQLRVANHRLQDANQSAQEKLEIQREHMQRELAKAQIDRVDNYLGRDNDYIADYGRSKRDERIGRDEIVGRIGRDEIDEIDGRGDIDGRGARNGSYLESDFDNTNDARPRYHPENDPIGHSAQYGNHVNVNVKSVKSGDINRPAKNSELLLSLTAQVALYKFRYTKTKARLRASIDISEFQKTVLAKLARLPTHLGDDSTTSLINGTFIDTASDSTTALILGRKPATVYDAAFPPVASARSKLRAVILAVLFTERLKALVRENVTIVV